MDGPLSVRNGNHNVLNSPKRLNTIQNSNVTTNNYTSINHTENLIDNDTNTITAVLDEQTNAHNNINSGVVDVQWCNGELTKSQQPLLQHRPLNINNGTLAVSLRCKPAETPASSPDDSLLDYEEAQSSSSADASPQDEDRAFDISDSEDSDDGNLHLGRGIVNPNYPGFQHLAHTLDIELDLDSEDDYVTEQNVNNNNNQSITIDTVNDKIDSVNRLDSVENIQKVFYDKPVFNICEQPPATEEIKESLSCGNIVGNFGEEVERELGLIYQVEYAVEHQLEQACEKLAVVDLQPAATKYNIEPNIEQPFVFQTAEVIEKPILHESVTIVSEKMQCEKLSDAFLSNAQDKLPECELHIKMEVMLDDSNRKHDEIKMADKLDEIEKFCKEDQTKDEKEKDEDSAVPRKKERTETYVKKRRDYNQQIGSLMSIPRRELVGRGRDNLNRRSLPLSARDRKKSSPEMLGGFDVYNIETAMPKIDLEVIETHLRAAREEERRRRTDREEIRRRLAMGNEEDYYNGCDRPGRKPSLQARLQSGMNLQICFMNETASDTESPSSDSECTLGKPKQAKMVVPEEKEKSLPPVRPATLSIGLQQPQSLPASMTDTDFFAKQARLQTEARMALAQAKEMARMQMEIERQRQKKSPITEMVRHSMEKVGIPFPEDRRRLSRQILTEMNVAQLQVIVNDLHTQIEILNESLVKFLMARDDLHMEQDSMLVDIEDLTRFLAAKEQIIKDHTLPSNNNASPPSPAPSSPMHFTRIKK